MIVAPGFVGCDVSKAHLDLFDGGLGRPERIPNRPDAIADRVALWRASGSFVLFEATGVYDAALRGALEAAGVAHVRVNPAAARAFARATGRLAKTDAIDARCLALMAQTLKPVPRHPRDDARERLAALVLRRDQLVGDRVRERNRREALRDPMAEADIALHIAFLDDRVSALEAAIEALIAAEAALADQAALLRSVPGVGPVTASTLMAAMPELGRLTPKAVAALAGLAPVNRDSGAMRGKRAIAGGRRRVRRALYMAAVAAIRTRHRFAAAYKALRNKGKPAKVALIAIARKLLVTANAILRDRQPFKAKTA